MPKKRRHSYQFKPPSSAHPSLQSSGRSHGSSERTTSNGLPSRQVNDLLLHLRRVHGSSRAASEAGPSPVQPAPSITLPLLYPPSQHQPQPELTPQERMRARARQRRLPGPPAPPSWTKKDKTSKSHSQLEQDASIKAKTMQRLPDLNLPGPKTLVHMCLRQLSVEWHKSIHVDNGEWLSVLPQHLKQALLAFLTVYGPSSIPLQDVKHLFVDNIYGVLDAPGSGAESISHLHLGFALDARSRRVYKEVAELIWGADLFKSVIERDRKVIRGADASTVGDVPESWDSDGPESGQSLFLTKTFQGARFASLSHLSLAHAESPSWRGLVFDLAPHIKQLSHLSLAFWPRPTLNTVSKTSLIQGPLGELPASSLDGYWAESPTDSDWSEAASVMQHLGRNLLCLEWLDLEGCSAAGGWLEALTWPDGAHESSPCLGSFRGLETLVIGQGHSPGSLARCKTRDDFLDSWGVWAVNLLRQEIIDNNPRFGALRRPSNFDATRVRDAGQLIDRASIPELYLWLHREYMVEMAKERLLKQRKRLGGAASLSVCGTPYPPWVLKLIMSTERTRHRYHDGRDGGLWRYHQFGLIGLSDDEILKCGNWHREP